VRQSGRGLKRKERFEIDMHQPAKAFRSAPVARRDSVPYSIEMGVPAWALPGKQLWAMGLRAGVRMRFKAEVTSLRKSFPRIVVKYVATEDGQTSRHVLPDLLTAYLHAGDLEERDW